MSSFTNSRTESWNGSNWTEVNNLNTVRELLGGSGTTNFCISFGGAAPGDSRKTESLEWNVTGLK